MKCGCWLFLKHLKSFLWSVHSSIQWILNTATLTTMWYQRLRNTSLSVRALLRQISHPPAHQILYSIIDSVRMWGDHLFINNLQDGVIFMESLGPDRVLLRRGLLAQVLNWFLFQVSLEVQNTKPLSTASLCRSHYKWMDLSDEK